MDACSVVGCDAGARPVPAPRTLEGEGFLRRVRDSLPEGLIATYSGFVLECGMTKEAALPRIERLRRGVAKKGLEGVVLVPGPNIEYYTGVRSQLLERPFLLFVPKEGDPQLSRADPRVGALHQVAGQDRGAQLGRCERSFRGLRRPPKAGGPHGRVGVRGSSPVRVPDPRHGQRDRASLR